MRIYFAGADNSIPFFQEMEIDSLLMAYPFLKKKEKIIPSKNYFIDSGAYSVMTTGIEINLNDYIKYIKKHDLKIYAGLDVIGNAEQTKKNCDIMKQHGLKPIPTYHYGEDLKHLTEYFLEYDYIAIGGLVPLKSDKRKMKQFLDNCFAEITKIKPLKKIHGFGLVNWEFMKRYPFYSVDATSWQNPTRYGQYFEMMNGKLQRKNGDKAIKHIIKDKNEQLKNSVLEFIKAEQYITKLWESRGIKWD